MLFVFSCTLHIEACRGVSCARASSTGARAKMIRIRTMQLRPPQPGDLLGCRACSNTPATPRQEGAQRFSGAGSSRSYLQVSRVKLGMSGFTERRRNVSHVKHSVGGKKVRLEPFPFLRVVSEIAAFALWKVASGLRRTMIWEVPSIGWPDQWSADWAMAQLLVDVFQNWQSGKLASMDLRKSAASRSSSHCGNNRSQGLGSRQAQGYGTCGSTPSFDEK